MKHHYVLSVILLSSLFTPPFFQKKGYHVVSLNKVAKWLGEKCEELGIEIDPGLIDGYLTLGESLEGLGEITRADSVYEAAAVARGDNTAELDARRRKRQGS